MGRDATERWVGLALSLIGVAATLWLALSGDLGLYIHPRYFGFTLVVTIAAAVVVVLAFAVLPRLPEAHDHEDPEERRAWRRFVRPAFAGLLVVVSAIALLALPPSSLSTAGVSSADVRSAAVTDTSPPSEALAGADYTQFTVKDWAALLRQGVSEDLIAGKEADLIGFVTADEEDPENIFYLARFSITCCAVDAQPVGVPVYSPGWQDSIDPDDWVQVRGAFEGNPSTTSTAPIVLRPAEVAVVEEPEEPYVY